MPKHADLEQAIAAQEQLRGRVPDAVVDASITALRQQLEALDIATPDEQRKLVTVLFADLAGWTKMAEQMDPEDVQAIQTRLLRCSHASHRTARRSRGEVHRRCGAGGLRCAPGA